jgi:hypothetical protein
MSSVKKIKRLFAKSEVTVNSKVDDRIVCDALTVFDKHEKLQSVSSGQNIWRIIMIRWSLFICRANRCYECGLGGCAQKHRGSANSNVYF